MTTRRHPKIIDIVCPRGMSYGRSIALAAFQRFRTAGYRPHMTEELYPEGRVHHLEVAGYIGFLTGPRAEAIQQRGVPAVNVSQAHGGLSLPAVLPDNRRAGQQAAEHLLERGYTNIIFAAHGDLIYSQLRSEGVRAAVHAAKARFEELAASGSATDPSFWETRLPRLPFPTGLVAADDTVAVAILEALPATSIRVPEQLAVVGITNDEIACATALVPLSSVDLNPARIGDRAAQLLLRLIAGCRPPRKPILVQPHGVVVRTSSDAFATTDPLIAQITRYARQHLADGVWVNQLARQFGMSRRNLSRLFQERTGTTPIMMLQRLAVERAKHLLANSDLTAPQVAAACGYDHLAHFGVLFRRFTGTTPMAYRESLGRDADDQGD
jgi:LacI family transcriptional regulator